MAGYITQYFWPESIPNAAKTGTLVLDTKLEPPQLLDTEYLSLKLPTSCYPHVVLFCYTNGCHGFVWFCIFVYHLNYVCGYIHYSCI